MEYCPKCRKSVNTSIQTLSLNDGVHTSVYCEECGMTIKNTVEKNIRLVNDNEKGNNYEQN